MSASRTSADDVPTVDARRAWSERIGAHRRRQASVSAILDQTFGRFAESDPALWDRRTYLMLVGVVYERLATDEAELPTDELIALAKLLAESRRADSQSRAREAANAATAPSVSANGPLPDSFGDVVRQIYGTDVERPVRDRDERNQSRASAS